MKKIMIGIIAVLAIIVITIYVQKKEQVKSEKPTVKIGVQLPLTGNIGFAGQVAQAAIKLELDKMKKIGTKYNYELIFEDVQLSPMSSAITTKKMIGIDKVNAIISIWSVAGNVISPIADENAVLSFGCSYGEQSTKGALNFNMAPQFSDLADLLSQELIKRKIKNVALIIENVGGNQELQKAIKNSLSKNNIQILIDEFPPFQSKDFRLLISKIKKANPQQIINIGTVPNPYIFLQQWQEAGEDKAKVTSIDGFAEMPSEQRPMANDLWYVDTNLFGNNEFSKDLKEKTGYEAWSCSGASASNLNILINAYEGATLKPGEVLPNSKDVADWIWKNVQDYDSPVGKVNVINEGLINVQPVVNIIKDGKRVTIEE